jgi:hypothetical protein
MVRRKLALLACVLACALTACDGSPAPPVREVVLHPGESVQATNKFGSVRVTYVSPLKRKFEWDGQSRVVEMIARPEPWLGELGIYDPASCQVIVIALCQTPRLVVAEAVHDFGSYDQLYAFVYEGSAVMDWVYTSDGLLVGFGRSPGRKQVSVDVRQLTIHGRKPTALRGARDRDVRLIRTRGDAS